MGKKRKKIEKKSLQPRLIFILVFFFFLIAFLAINIFFSQNLSPLFLKVINPDYQSVLIYLKKIKNTAYFSPELENFKKIYGQKIVYDVFSEEIEREKTIKKLEATLQKNPDSSSILYSLFLLYDQAGNKEMANKYLKRAKAIDPWIDQ